MMYYHYIIMKHIQLLSEDDATVRTQITLTKKIKSLVEEHAKAQNESLSEYLRKAALIRWLVEHNEREERKKIAQEVLGSIDISQHPEWSTKERIYHWSRKIREEKT